MGLEGTVFNIQRFSVDDGPGIRTCVFLKGCPLNCPWCHNAESLSFAPELAFFQDSCIGCGKCVSLCSRGAISLKNGKAELDRTKCNLCGKCAENCPCEALSIQGKKMSADEVMDLVLRDRSFYGTNGGITITGGEPLSQPAFTLALAKKAKEEGISVAIETSGQGKTEDFLALVEYCDLFLFDCKASSDHHRKICGKDDSLILKNLDALCNRDCQIILRCPIVLNGNLEEDFIQKIIYLAKKYPQIKTVQLMPYHATGRYKGITLGKEEQPLFKTPSKDELIGLSARIEQESKKEVVFS